MTAIEIVDHSIQIHASPRDVWAAITDPERIPAWYAGFAVRSTYEVGAPITFTGVLNGKTYHDHGTILACEPERTLSYDHWTAVSRLPDAPGNRTVITLTLTPIEGGTQVHARHDNFPSDVAFKHGRFFWRGALYDLRKLLEAGR